MGDTMTFRESGSSAFKDRWGSIVGNLGVGVHWDVAVVRSLEMQPSTYCLLVLDQQDRRESGALVVNIGYRKEYLRLSPNGYSAVERLARIQLRSRWPHFVDRVGEFSVLSLLSALGRRPQTRLSSALAPERLAHMGRRCTLDGQKRYETMLEFPGERCERLDERKAR
jgi:hypothetical protein